MPLITTIAEIKKYCGIDANTNIATLQPFIDDAENWYVTPLLSKAFYDVLKTSYDNASQVVDDIVDANHKAIMPLIQRTIANYALFLSVNEIGSSFGDSGIQQQFGEDSQPAPGWKVRSLQENFVKKADIHAEKLLEYLETKATVSIYGEWFSSSVNTKMSGLIVYSTKIASKYIDINESRRIFLRLKKRIEKIESKEIKRLIGEDQYEEIVTQIKTGSLSSANTNLIEVLEPIIAKKSLYLTLPSIQIGINNEGLTLFSSTDGVNQKQIAGQTEKLALMKSLREGDYGYESDEQEAKEFIENNIDDYPLIEASTAWTSKADPGPKHIPENSADNKHFSV